MLKPRVSQSRKPELVIMTKYCSIYIINTLTDLHTWVSFLSLLPNWWNIHFLTHFSVSRFAVLHYCVGSQPCSLHPLRTLSRSQKNPGHLNFPLHNYIDFILWTTVSLLVHPFGFRNYLLWVILPLFILYYKIIRSTK